jgi:hypothetical protein
MYISNRLQNRTRGVVRYGWNTDTCTSATGYRTDCATAQDRHVGQIWMMMMRMIVIRTSIIIITNSMELSTTQEATN